MRKNQSGQFWTSDTIQLVSHGKAAPASVNTRKNPDMSVIVVRIGPEARAGSWPSPRSTSGMMPRGRHRLCVAEPVAPKRDLCRGCRYISEAVLIIGDHRKIRRQRRRARLEPDLAEQLRLACLSMMMPNEF